MARTTLKAQTKIRQNKQLPKEIKNIQLTEELDEIRKNLVYEKLEIDDTLPMICEKFAEGEYKFEPLEDNHVLIMKY